MIRTALVWICCNLGIALFGQSAYWQQQVNYDIKVELNDQDHSITGFEQIEYINHSPDTLHFIWFQLWPNAYKNDRTAFSDQLLQNGNTQFYFSNEEKRGYINRIEFKVNGTVVRTEDHAQHQDIVKIVLASPLAPGASCTIETPFHVKLPYNISRGGHNGQSYQITQWYPKPAVYDQKGWHPMPYLDQGEFYSEFGNYTVHITVPIAYKLAATGMPVSDKQLSDKKGFKSISYQQDNVHDFAWFADKNFVIHTDTMRLHSGKTILVAAYTLSTGKYEEAWRDVLPYIKKTVRFRSRLLGEYPYPSASVVEADVDYPGGMEYPMITAISGVRTDNELEGLVEHEVGHNWLCGILATDERTHAWMDEGMNTYYDNRYKGNAAMAADESTQKRNFISARMPADPAVFSLNNAIADRTDQPIETPSQDFSGANYDPVVYTKTAQWMQLLEQRLGQPVFDSCMREYYRRWQFKHPSPEDFEKVFIEVSGQDLTATFSLLSKKGALPVTPSRREIKFASFFSFRDTDKYRYIFAAPIVGYNFYDKLMIGAAIHNYTLPAEHFQFLAAPLYATGSGRFTGLGRVSYSWFPGAGNQQLTLFTAVSSFDGDAFTDSTGKKNYMRFSKLVPGVRIDFAVKNPLRSITSYLQWKTYLIQEQTLDYTRDTVNQVDVITYPTRGRYFNQLIYAIENHRVLYPYKAEFRAEQGSEFVRLAFTGNYFFNYPKGGGLNLRFFAGKFFYIGSKTYLKQSDTDPYQLNMTGPKGYEDYGYSNYFIGRSEFEGLSTHQLMERDGFFKVRTDLLGSKIGKTDNWLAAVNLVTAVPSSINPLKVLPIQIPLKIFVDIGTYAEAWQSNATVGKFIYDAGLQVSLFKNVLNIYWPILYSKVYGDYFKSTLTGSRFSNNLVFTIDIQNISLKKLLPQLGYWK